MSAVAVLIPSPRVPVSLWTSETQRGLDLLKTRGLEEVRVLADSVPGAATWVAAPVRSRSGVTFTAVLTDWASANPARARNEALLAGSTTVVVLGHVMTASAKHTLARVFGSTRQHVVQVIDGTATQVGRDTIVTAPGYEIPAPKAEAPSEGEGWSAFAATASTKKSKR